jgi:NAD(P)-dependent dehydrogenase (short-subunit alcohol dehydrogenase family)
VDTGLAGSVALVTGASRGIGAATALALAREGAQVVLVSRRQEGVDAAAAQIRAAVPDAELLAVAAHVADPDASAAACAAAVERFGGIDVLVNNAGTNPYFGPLVDLDLARAEKTVQVNQWAPLAWVQAAWHASMSARGGAVVNVASVGAVITEPAIAWYNATKAALVHLTRHLAAELGPTVRVNAVAPGVVRTQLAKLLVDNAEDRLSAALPLRRIGEPDDVADAIVFLASRPARWITGQTLVVDGGTSVRASVT